jgi:hypothetical protein
MQPPSGGLAPCPLVEVLQNARASLWRQCCLFSDRLVRAAIFYFDHPRQRAKALSKDYACAGIFVNADTAALCLRDFCHDGQALPRHQASC